MSSEIFDSERYPLKQVALKLKVHIATIWRWVLHGVRGQRLPTILVGGRRYVLKSDLEAFLAPHAQDAGHATDLQTRAGVAGKLLDAHGFKEV